MDDDYKKPTRTMMTMTMMDDDILPTHLRRSPSSTVPRLPSWQPDVLPCWQPRQRRQQTRFTGCIGDVAILSPTTPLSRGNDGNGQCRIFNVLGTARLMTSTLVKKIDTARLMTPKDARAGAEFVRRPCVGLLRFRHAERLAAAEKKDLWGRRRRSPLSSCAFWSDRQLSPGLSSDYRSDLFVFSCRRASPCASPWLVLFTNLLDWCRSPMRSTNRRDTV